MGFGTMGVEDPETVAAAIDCGYRHVDTAQIYGNEAAVGEGIARSAVDRAELVVATKVWVDRLGGESVIPSVRESLDRLGLDRVDLLYVHRPTGAYDPEETLPAFERAVELGLTDAIGVSNFELPALEAARSRLSLPIAVHQIEHHPLFRRESLLQEAAAHDTAVVGYSPLAGGAVFDLEPVRSVAEDRGRSPAAVAIAWARARGVVPIPKASTREHLRANLAATDLELTDDELAAIDGIDRERELFPE